METRRHYARAPITEAVIDIRVTLPPESDLETLRSLHEVERERYPNRQDAFRMLGEISLGPKFGASASKEQVGFRCESGSQPQLFQANLTGFTFHRLAPYERWEEFSAEARRLWDQYVEIAQPTQVTRLAVRYVNSISVPIERDLADYLRTVPVVSATMPHNRLSSYFMQLQFPQDDFDGMAVINQALNAQDDPVTSSVLLDIDVFREVSLDTLAPSLWDAMEQLHARENAIFEASITDITREVIS